MRVYYIPLQDDSTGTLVATHEEFQNIPDEMYGTNARSFIIDDIKNLTRVGDAPPENKWDTRPIKIPGVDIAVLRDSATKKMLQALTTAADTITSKYTQSEQLSWGTKDAAARAYLASETLTETQTTLLQSEASAGGNTDLKTLCEGIVANAESFAKISGTLAGLRTATAEAIAAAKSQTDLDAALVNLSNKIAVLFTSVNAAASSTTVSTS